MYCKKNTTMSKEIKTEIQIQARPDKVWEILCDFENYHQWNPFIKKIKGETRSGSRLEVFIEPPQSKGMRFRPVVLVFKPQKEFRWLGKLWMKGLFDGEHAFELIDNGDGSTTFIHSEKFKGLLVPFLSKMLDVNTKNGFELMNYNLKRLAENN